MAVPINRLSGLLPVTGPTHQENEHENWDELGDFSPTWSPAQKVEATARVGATGLELNIDTNQLWTQRLDGAARRALRQQADDAGVTIHSVCINAHWVFNLANPEVRIAVLVFILRLETI